MEPTGKYSSIQELIRRWSQYEQQTHRNDIQGFGKWLTSQDEIPLPNDEGCIRTQLSEETTGHQDFYKSMPESRQFLTLISRSARFIDFYIKKAFDDLEITSRLDFQFLISIKEMDKPRKTDVISFNLVEISTGVETLNRLIKSGFVIDFVDGKDKRIRRVQLTQKGIKLVEKALLKFDMLDQLVSTFGHDNSWKSFVPTLIYFNDYHNRIYHEHKEKNFEELLNQMGINSDD